MTLLAGDYTIRYAKKADAATVQAQREAMFTAMGETAETVDDIVIINKARIVATGTLSEVTPGHASLEEAFFSLTGTQPGQSW